jgi:Helix-turn-helix domain
VALSAPDRERLRSEIDRARRERIGARYADRAEWVTIPEASNVLGVSAQTLRARARERGLLMWRRGGRAKVRVGDLDLLR